METGAPGRREDHHPIRSRAGNGEPCGTNRKAQVVGVNASFPRAMGERSITALPEAKGEPMPSGIVSPGIGTATINVRQRSRQGVRLTGTLSRRSRVRGKLSCPVRKAGRREQSLLPGDQNRLHSRRDVALAEDAYPVRNGTAPHALAVLNSFVLALFDCGGVTHVKQQMRRLEAQPLLAVPLLFTSLGEKYIALPVCGSTNNRGRSSTGLPVSLDALDAESHNSGRMGSFPAHPPFLQARMDDESHGSFDQTTADGIALLWPGRTRSDCILWRLQIPDGRFKGERNVSLLRAQALERKQGWLPLPLPPHRPKDLVVFFAPGPSRRSSACLP